MSAKKFTRTAINAILNRSDRAVEVGIVRLNQLQTADERTEQTTKYHNNQGFQSCHARRGTYMANWVMSGRKLTGDHLAKARKICLKHSGQLTKIANGEWELPKLVVPKTR